MKVYSLNAVSVHQEDSKMNTVQPSLPAQGMFLDTPQKLSELDPQDFVKTVNNINNAQAAYQSQTDAENNAKGKAMAKGYTYHGIEEAEQNSVLFQGGALEKGHAYYIKGFSPAKYSPTNAAVIKSLFGESNPILVSYKDQKVKADIMNESSFWGEYFPVTVIVTADTVLPNSIISR